MIQATGWNSLERTASDWRNLFASVSKQYHFLGTRTPQGSAVSLIEARFDETRQEEGGGDNPIRTNDTAVLAS